MPRKTDTKARALALKSEGLNGAQIAEQLGVTKQYISKALNGSGSTDDSDDNGRYRKARADLTEAKAEQERLRSLEMAGKLVRRDAVDAVVRSFEARVRRASERVAKLPYGRDANEILREALRGLDNEIQAMLTSTPDNT